MDFSDEIQGLKKRLGELETERTSLLNQIQALENTPKEYKPVGTIVSSKAPQTPEEKVDLFLRLFRCRESVYPKLWENKKKGIKGYSPACKNEWVKGLCNKTVTKCSDCVNQSFLPLDEKTVQSHLQGFHTIGTYAIREDDTCIFLACDFDESGWQTDAFLYQSVAESFGIQACIERSRSGKGAHAWIFFSEPVSARLARHLGTALLAKASEQKHTMSLNSYDRFFPNQDYIPKGGFGNLIALPLQREPRQKDNSVFIDRKFKPIEDQWSYLASIRRLSLAELKEALNVIIPKQQQDVFGAEQDIAYATDGNILTIELAEVPAKEKFVGTVEVIFSAQISLSIEGLPSALIAKLKRIATFPNPKFYELQRMRMSTYPNPRFIFSGELSLDSITLPRGLLEKAVKTLQKAGATVVIRDERKRFKRIKMDFVGMLTPSQQIAVDETKKKESGVLVAPPGAGKTVMACAVIAHRKLPTLILVHRQPLIEQWKERLSTFLGLTKADIGQLSGAKKKCSGKVDIVMLQTLVKSQELEDVVDKYGQVIIDECHHIPATSFESVLKQIPARYILGLTATPYRKDRLEKIIFQQCGSICYDMKFDGSSNLIKQVIVRETNFKIPEELGLKPPYHIFIEYLAKDEKRLDMIVADIITSINDGRFPMIIGDRKELLQSLENKLHRYMNGEASKIGIYRLDGEVTSKQRKGVLEKIKELLTNQNKVCLLATASLLGEGFDLPELDTLFLTSPLSFRGRLIQYAGRLHRITDKKKSAIIHDYLDSNSPIAIKMYRNRLKAYKEMGYQVVVK
jgi:superfamily II DNA or RNA helicase